jgi:hypothetical protein
MLSLKDWRFIFRLSEYIAQEAYRLGREDEKSSKSRNDKHFRINGPVELLLKKKYAEFINNA